MAAKIEQSQRQLARVLQISPSTSVAEEEVKLTVVSNSLQPVPGEPLDEFLSNEDDPIWQEISQYRPGFERNIMFEASPPDAELIAKETNPAIQAPAGNESVKLIMYSKWKSGGTIKVYERPLIQNEGPAGPKELEEFVILTQVDESGTHYSSDVPLTYCVEEQTFASPSIEEKGSGLIRIQAVAKKTQTLRKARNTWMIVARPQESLPPSVPPVFQNEFQNAPAATLDPTVKSTGSKPGEWFTLDPVKP